MKSEKSPNRPDIKTYKERISNLVGQEINIIVNPNGHSEREVVGVVSYAASSMFGVIVKTEKGDYTVSYSYIDMYTGKIKVKNI